MQPGERAPGLKWLARIFWRPLAMVVVWALIGVALALYLCDPETTRAALLARVGIGLLAIVGGLGLWGLVRHLPKRQGEYGLVWMGAVLGGLALSGTAFLRTHNSYMFWLGMTFWFSIGGLFAYGAVAARPAPGQPYGVWRRVVQVLGCVGAVVGFGYFLVGGLALGMQALGYEPVRGSGTTSSPSSSPSSGGHPRGWIFWLMVSVMLLNAVVWASAWWQRRRRRRIYAALEADGVPSPEGGASLQVQYATAQDYRSWWRRPMTAVGYLVREPEGWVFTGTGVRGGGPVLLRFPVPLPEMTLVKGGTFMYRAMRWLRLGEGPEAHFFTVESGVTLRHSAAVTRAAYDRLLADARPPASPDR